MGLSNDFSYEDVSFSCCLNPHRFFFSERFGALFPCTGTLGCMVHLTPQLVLLVYPQTNVGSASCCLAASPLHPGCLSLPLLPVWLNLSSLTPSLSDFPYSSIFWQFWLFFVFKFVVLLLVMQGGKVSYLCLHLNQKSLKHVSSRQHML